MLKSSQNKKGQKFFWLHHFLNHFLQLAAEKKNSKTGAAIKFFWLLLFCDSFNVYLINISLFVYYRSPGWKQSDIWNPTCSSIWPKLQLRLLTELKPPRARKWRNCKGSDAVAEKNPIVMLKMRLDFFFSQRKNTFYHSAFSHSPSKKYFFLEIKEIVYETYYFTF